MRGRGLGWGLQEKNHQGLLIEGHRNKNRSWASSPRPPSFPPFLLLLCSKQNYYIVCVHMHMYVLVHICGISEDSLQEWVLSYHVHPWDPATGLGQVPLLSQPSGQLPPFQHLVGKNPIWPERCVLRVFFYTRNKQTPTLATMFQVVCRSLYSNFSLFPYEMGR